MPADPGTTSIAASSITVAPITGGLTFLFNQTATSFAILDSVFGFNASVLNAGTVTGETLTLTGSSETGFGDLTGIGYSCKGAVSATGTCSSAAARNLGVDEIFGTPVFTDQVSYAGLALTGQAFDLSADSSGGGTATLGAANITFTSAVAPEPSTLFLSAGVLALAFLGRKKFGFAPLLTESFRSK